MNSKPAKPLRARALVAALGLLLLAAVTPGALAAPDSPAAPGATPAPGDAVDLSGLRPGVDYVPGELVVHLRGAAERELDLPAGIGLAEAADALAGNPNVDYAAPNYLARAAACPFPACPPGDPATMAGSGDWRDRQWNFLTDINDDPHPGDGHDCPAGLRCGVNALGAWQKLSAVGHPGASNVRIAVVDSGVAYRNLGTRFKRSPDFSKSQFATGYDFVAKDGQPLDLYGHGTHVAGTIGQRVNNGVALTGLAYNARMIPVRVLDGRGRGSSANVAKGIRFAADRHAAVINLSFDFPVGLDRFDLPGVHKAIKYANARGALIVAAAGNQSKSKLPYPAAGPNVVAVGATTEHGCLANYSNRGNGSTADRHLDIVAPGGGQDDALCVPSVGGRPIYQVTLKPHRGRYTRFGIPGDFIGTSQATAHVSAIAAMTLASGALPSHPSQAVLLQRLKSTGTPLAAPYGYVRLVDATEATTAP
jgi:serine protease